MEVIENTMALRDSLKNQLTKDAQAQADYDAVQTLAGIIPAGWQQQDMTVLSGNQSAAAAVPSVQGGFNYAAALGQSKDLMGMLANLTSPASKQAAVQYPDMQGPMIAGPQAGSLGTGSYGLNDFSTPQFFTSTTLL